MVPIFLDKEQKQIAKYLNKSDNQPQTLTLTAYPTATQGSGGIFFFDKMAAKNNFTINCSHLVTKTSVLVGPKILKGVVTTPSVDEFLKYSTCLLSNT